MGHAFIRKVHTLYQRVLRKYPGNVGLWLDFASFCFSHGNARLLSEVVSQGLLLNPQCAGLWCFAANWEYKHKGDIASARHLLLRGLRNCAQSKVLWQVYFRLELKYAGDVYKRNEILEINTVPIGEHLGAVAQCVFEAARKVHPHDPLFHTQFIYVTAQFQWAKELKENMIDILTSGFDGENDENKTDATLYRALLASASGSDGAVASCGSLAALAVTSLISRVGGDEGGSDRGENVLGLIREVFGGDATAPHPRAVDRLHVALLGSANATAQSTQACAAFGFDKVHEATVVTAALKKTQPGARKYHEILTGNVPGAGKLPADVRVCRDDFGDEKNKHENKHENENALEQAVFDVLSEL